MQQGKKSILIQSPTGSGKTLLTAHMLHTAAQKGMRCWFVVHRKELVEQSSKAFLGEGLTHGIIARGFQENRRCLVQIASVQTLAKRYRGHVEPRLIVWDEAHHVAAKSWKVLFEAFQQAYHIGLSATPERLDGQGLGKYFKEMIHGPTVSWLIENKFLSPYKLYAPAHVNLDDVHKRMGDYDRAELSRAMDKPKITGSAVEHYKKFASGKRAIVFAVSIEHSKHIVEEFQKGGFNAAHIDGETSADRRAEITRQFAAGSIQILSNVDLFGEGYDLPSIECAILLRPTQSLGLYLQSIGRALRTSPGKSHALLFDHVGNCERFGLPDEDRTWSLEGREKRKCEFIPPVKVCQMCYGAQKPSPACVFCGYVFPVVSREVEQVAGTLTEIDRQQLALKLKWKRQQQGMASGYKELVEIGKARGFKRPEAWAAIIIKARQAKKLAAQV